MYKTTIDLESMPANTRLVFEKLAEHRFISDFTLVGGTALSIQINHRLSEDLDFIYDHEKLNLNAVKRKIASIFPKHRIIRQDFPWQIDFVINDVKVTFFSAGAIALPFQVKKHSFNFKTIRICNANIIATLKMATIAQRNTIRDYYDLYFLAKHHLSLKEMIDQTKKMVPNLSPITYTETLIYTNDIEEESLKNHLEPKENITKEQIAAFFIQELRKIKDEL